jgi:hypothetical protein
MTRKLVPCLAATAAVIVLLMLAGNRPIHATGSMFTGFPCPSNALLPNTNFTCVMKELDGVRGLAFGPEGALYVAEAGHGGDGPCSTESGVRVCYGPTGAITRLLGDVQKQILKRLPSLAINDPSRPGATGQTANGPTDISFASGDEQDDDGEDSGEVPGAWTTYITIGLRNNPNIRDMDLAPVGEGFARLLRVGPHGEIRPIADLGAYEIENNPDGGTIDTNPFGLLVEPGSRLVVDAGANALLRVQGNGHGPISTVATFPSRGQGRLTDAVPTSVAVGPDGAYYVSELTGIPFTTWDASIYRVVPGEAPTVYLHGFKMIVDIAFDADGNLYVLQHATVTGSTFGRSGVLTKVAPDGTRTTVISGLRTPTSVAIGPDGFVYVANRGVFPAVGEVVQVAP